MPQAVSSLQADFPFSLYNFVILNHFLHLVMKGNSHNLMKAGAKRRRTKEEIKEEKLEEMERIRDIEEKVQRFSAMEAELAELRG